MKRDRIREAAKAGLMIAAVLSGITGILWDYIPGELVRGGLYFPCACIFFFVFLWERQQRKETVDFANNICETVEALLEDRRPDNYHPYEDSMASKVEGKLIQYYDKMREGQKQTVLDKQTIQELVSDISHQVKTPVANIRMFTGILRQHSLSEEKRAEFLETMEGQIHKLDFLMQSLVKMSRLETGTFTLLMEEKSLYDTIAQAVGGVWAKAEHKKIEIDVECGPQVRVKHDTKWTAEALGNILDNAVKYTPGGGHIHVNVRPWQFYTRVDITDSGIGIQEEHYHDIFKRFYRAQEVAAEEGVGLGLYLARGIIARQKGYISVKSKAGQGTTFSVYLLN